MNKDLNNIFSVALPMILAAVSIPLLGIVDTAILGHLESPVYLASINIGVTIFNILFWGMGFLRMSTTGMVAQAYGQSDHQKVEIKLSQALLVALTISFILLIFKDILISIILPLIANGGQAAELAKEYYSIRIFSAPATLTLLVLSGYFLALQQTNKVLVLVTVNQIVNMVLDYYFVMELKLGIQGVAWGSVISEYLALFAGVFFLYSQGFNLKKWLLIFQYLRKPKSLSEFLSVNRDIFIRTVCLVTVFTMMTKGSANQGELTLAVNAVLMNFFYFMSYALDGFAHAVESICGKYYGSKNYKKFHQVLGLIFKISFLISMLFALFYLVFGQSIINRLTSLMTVQTEAGHYIYWIIAVVVVSMPSFVYDGVFVATTEAKIMRNTMVVATIFCYIPLWFFGKPYGNHGLWMAFLGFFIIRSLAVHIYYLKWKQNWKISIQV